MNFIFENEIVIGLMGLTFASLLIYAGLRLAESRVWISGIAAVAVTLFLVALSVWVETDNESLRRTMGEVATALRENDREKVFSYFHPNATEGIQHVRGELPLYKFKNARITRIVDISVNPTTQPATATSEFVAAVRVSHTNPNQYDGSYDVRRLVKVYWMKNEDSWLIRDYEHFDVMQAFTDR
jgi:hypothetical protein